MVPEDKDGFEDSDGCPDLDNDKDGIPDDADGEGGACKNEPEDKDDFQDDDGCPDLDNDGDGTEDDADGKDGACKNDPEDKDGFQDGDGCPEADNDNDGIEDGDDRCPGRDGDKLPTAEDKDGFEDEDGCPELDNDNDKIPDARDQCPDLPEIENGWLDSDGCPDLVPSLIGDATLKGPTFSRRRATRGQVIMGKAASGLASLLDAHKRALFAKGEPFKLSIVVYSPSDELAQRNAELAKQSTLAALERKVAADWWQANQAAVNARVTFQGCSVASATTKALNKPRVEVALTGTDAAPATDLCTLPPSVRGQIESLTGVFISGKKYFQQSDGALQRDRRKRLRYPNIRKRVKDAAVTLSAYKKFQLLVMSYASTGDVARDNAAGVSADLQAEFKKLNVSPDRVRWTEDQLCPVTDASEFRIELQVLWDGQKPAAISCERPPSLRKASPTPIMSVGESAFDQRALNASSEHYNREVARLKIPLSTASGLPVWIASYVPADGNASSKRAKDQDRKRAESQATKNARTAQRSLGQAGNRQVSVIPCVGPLRITAWLATRAAPQQTGLCDALMQVDKDRARPGK